MMEVSFEITPGGTMKGRKEIAWKNKHFKN
jgi:hypothetical protein